MEMLGPSTGHTVSAEEMVADATWKEVVLPLKATLCLGHVPDWVSASSYPLTHREVTVRINGKISLSLEKVESCKPRQFCRSVPM